MIHDTVTKAFGSEVTVHDILITSSSCASGGQEKYTIKCSANVKNNHTWQFNVMLTHTHK